VIDALGPTTEIADIEDLPHVALDVGGDVAGEPFGGVDVAIVDGRIAALPQGGPRALGLIESPTFN
jgi:hypothetical protein